MQNLLEFIKAVNVGNVGNAYGVLGSRVKTLPVLFSVCSDDRTEVRPKWYSVYIRTSVSFLT